MIEIHDLSLKYMNGKGIFDQNFEVEQGEVFGYIGPEGAGKTTMIRILMGFHRSSKGKALIDGMNCYWKASAIQKKIGYIPEEPVFFEEMRVKSYLRFMNRMRRINPARMEERKNELVEVFGLKTNGRIDRLGPEEKQKISIITAFMHDPEILIMDQPFKNLNPALQSQLANLIIDEKKRGKTVFLTSQIFSEVERVSDRIGLIRDGYMIEMDDVVSLKAKEIKSYRVRFAESPNLEQLKKFGFGYKEINPTDFEIYVPGNRIDALIKVLSHEKVLIFNSNKQTLEESFHRFYTQKGEEVV